MLTSDEKKYYLFSLSISFSIIILGLFLYLAITNYTKSNDIINVTGSASKDIKSDYGILTIRLITEDENPSLAYNSLQNNLKILLNFLNSQNIENDKIDYNSIYNYVYSTNPDAPNTKQKYHYEQSVIIKLNDVYKIKDLSNSVSGLVSKGVYLQVEPPLFYYSKIQDIKAQVQAEATQDAIKRASKILSTTNSQLGDIKNVRVGVIQITPINSQEISDYGMNDASSINKKITAVVNVSFKIK
ncbi:MAG TPA: SIMPL domain-containing protein [Ignavibacteriales bacterium]|nr:SIMPL domain-containing protein [Ignavibacteriales bacterium]